MSDEYFSKHVCNDKNHNGNLCVPDTETEVDERGLGPVLLEKLRQYSNNVAQVECSSGKQELYSDFTTRCIRTAQKLQALGVSRKDIISLCTFNNMDCFIPIIASFLINVRVACLDSTLSLSDAEIMLKMVKPRFIFCDEEGAKLIEKINQRCNTNFEIVFFGDHDKYLQFSEFIVSSGMEDSFEAVLVDNVRDVVTISFSSGTTGLPKGICQSHFSYLSSLKSYNYQFKVLIVSRLFWLSGMFPALMSIISGGNWFICNESDKENLPEIVYKRKVNFLMFSPYYAYKFKEKFLEMEPLQSMKICLVIGDVVTKELIETYKKPFPNAMVATTYGMTETLGSGTAFNATNIHYLTPDRLHSAGRVITGTCIRVVDPDTNKLLGPNQPGEIRIKTLRIMNGYYENEKATHDAFDEEGYLRTGDYGYYDDEYCFCIIDRLKTVYKFRNWSVSAGELEGVLLTHPDVAEAAVVGIKHVEDGHHLMGVVVLRPDATATADQICHYVNEQVPDVKQLRAGVRIVETLPRTVSLKIQKKVLLDMFTS